MLLLGNATVTLGTDGQTAPRHWPGVGSQPQCLAGLSSHLSAWPVPRPLAGHTALRRLGGGSASPRGLQTCPHAYRTGEAEPGLTRKRGGSCALSYFPPGWRDGLTAEGTWREALSLQDPGHVTHGQRLEAGQEAASLGMDGCEGWPRLQETSGAEEMSQLRGSTGGS